jgi:hypothetical protein
VDHKNYPSIKAALPRLLSLLDRNPSSPSYGCFDKDYWHFKTKDFASSAEQMSVLTLSLLYKNKFEDNEFYDNPICLQWIKAGIQFLAKIQHSDGSFDEWYPNERGWAGPTSYIVYCLSETYHLLGDELGTEKNRLNEILFSASLHLSRRDESDVLANHIAITLSALASVQRIFSDSIFKESYEKFRGYFLDHTVDEGWSLEYDGLDVGYNLASISFLSRIPWILEDQALSEYIKKSFNLLKYFCFPGGSFGGNLGSRHTLHFYPFATSFWADKNEDALLMETWRLKFLNSDNHIQTQDQDDHYIHYRMWEYLQADLNSQALPVCQLKMPYEQPPFTLDLPQSGISIQKTNKIYLVMNRLRGGSFRAFDCNAQLELISDSGYLLKSKSKVYTSLHSGLSKVANFLGNHSQFTETKNPYFTPFKNIAFRSLMMTFGAHTYSAYLFKRLIRKLLIVGNKPAEIELKRKIHFDGNTLNIRDEIKKSPRIQIDQIWGWGEFEPRYVPQSRYYRRNSSKLTVQEIEPHYLKKLNEDNSVQIIRNLDF